MASTKKSSQPSLKPLRCFQALLPPAISLIRTLPLPLCFTLGASAGLIAWATLPHYRALARENIRRALGPSARPSRLTLLHFMRLGANLLSALKIPALNPQQINQISTVHGLHHINNSLNQGRGVVLTISHLGNWELYAQLVFHLPHARFGTIYQALRNKQLDALITRDRRRMGVLAFERKKGYQDAITLLRKPGVLGVLVDQHAGDPGLWTPLFGRLCSTSLLAATLAIRSNALIIPCAIHTTGLAKWKVTVSPPIEPSGHSPSTLTAEINRHLEQQILASPPDWLWLHNRWKTPHPKFLIAQSKRGVFIPPSSPPLKPFSILVRSPNWLGDAVMAVPAIRSIKNGRPDASITVACPQKLTPLWKKIPEVDHVIPLPKNLLLSALKLRRQFDAAIILPNSLRSALETWLAGIPRRVGFTGHHRHLLLNQILTPPKKNKTVPRPLHHSRRYTALATSCGAPPADLPPPLWSPPPHSQIIQLALCPGAEFGPAKRWPPEKFRATMEKISRRIACHWTILGSKTDIPVAQQIASGLKCDLTNLAGKTSLDQLIHHLLASHALLTNDTGTMHLADLLGIPLVAIFGSTEPLLTGPSRPTSKVLRHHVECSPCFLRSCPLDFRCMEAIRPDTVAKSLIDLIPNPPLRNISPPQTTQPWKKSK